MAQKTPFDNTYYKRFYGKVGVHNAEKIAHHDQGIHSLCAWWGLPIRSGIAKNSHRTLFK
jgi:hypothetical protein